MDIEQVKAGFSLIKDGIKKLDSGPIDFYLEQLTGCYHLLITRFAPFKIGETVKLAKTPVINDNENWGWRGSKHFLVEGSICFVREVDVDKDGFIVSVEFERDSWIEAYTGKITFRDPNNRLRFQFREQSITKV